MSIYPLALDGWDHLSTWGWDSQLGSLYAQLTRNGNSDDDGPDVWISPPTWPKITLPELLGEAIAKVTGAEQDAVFAAMSAGLDDEGRNFLRIPPTTRR
jgi:hypothetical protein